jgi:hypothetical protein
LYENFVQILRVKGYYKLCQVADRDLTTIWKQEWKDAGRIGLEGNEATEWSNYISLLRSTHVRIKDEEEDEPIWSKNTAMGRYTPKTGYMALCEDRLVEMSCWWGKTIWKYKCPLKSRIFMWLALNNKIFVIFL